MNQQIRVLKTPKEYDAAIARLSELMDIDFSEGSAEESEFELLSLVIQSYEEIVAPLVIPDPIDAILFVMDQKNLSARDLVPMMGSVSKVSEVLSRKRALSLSMIRAIHAGLGIPAEVLIANYHGDGIDLSVEPQYDYKKFPLQEMRERGCFPKFATFNNIADFAEEAIRDFLGDLHDQSLNAALLRAPLHQSGAREINDYALFAWRGCVIKKAQRVKLSQGYTHGVITDGWLRDLAKLSSFERGPVLAQEYCAKKGIILVIEPHFKKTYLDGAAMLYGNTPIVALTLRHDRIDNFWFALLHELVHIHKHLTSDYAFIADTLDDKTRTSQQEREADEGARNALIPPDDWVQATVAKSHAQIDALALADKLSIHPEIVAGRVRYEANNYKLLNRLRGDSVKVNFSEYF